MQFSTVLSLLSAAGAALATPAFLADKAALEARQLTLCSGSNTPQCCAVDVLGIADLDCENPKTTPGNTTEFIDICAEEGHTAMCCLLPLLDQGLICNTVQPSA